MCDTPRPSKSGKMLDAETWDAMKAAGVSEQELLDDQPFGPIIASYTRKQAIADGVLVDLCEPGTTIERAIREWAGIRLHTAMTVGAFDEVFGEAVYMPPDPDGASQEVTENTAKLLFSFRKAVVEADGPTDRVHFKVDVVHDGEHHEVRLWALVGPGDDAEPVMTIMLEGED